MVENDMVSMFVCLLLWDTIISDTYIEKFISVDKNEENSSFCLFLVFLINIMALSRMVYDDLYEICRNRTELLIWLSEKDLLGKFKGPCRKCFEGVLHLVKDSSYSKDKQCYR